MSAALDRWTDRPVTTLAEEIASRHLVAVTDVQLEALPTRMFEQLTAGERRELLRRAVDRATRALLEIPDERAERLPFESRGPGNIAGRKLGAYARRGGHSMAGYEPEPGSWMPLQRAGHPGSQHAMSCRCQRCRGLMTDEPEAGWLDAIRDLV